MGNFSYFAYGSNLLRERLGHEKRCPSCEPISPAKAVGYTVSFDKVGRDGSGKATITKKAGSAVYGRLFEISSNEAVALDRVEDALGKNPGYRREDAFAVDVGTDRKTVRTYVGLKLAAPGVLKPYDWYLALVVAGAIQGGLPESYIASLRAVPFMTEPPASLEQEERDRLTASKKDAIGVLSLAGFKSIEFVLRS